MMLRSGLHFPTPIMWSRLLSILFLNHCTIARPQGQVDTLTQFLPDNLQGAAFGTPLIATGDTSSDSNSEPQQIWAEGPESLPLAGPGCNGAANNQNSHSRSRRSFIKGSQEVCSPNDEDQILKQGQQVDQGQQPGQGAAQPLRLNPTSVSPDQPEKMKTPPKGVYQTHHCCTMQFTTFQERMGNPMMKCVLSLETPYFEFQFALRVK